jgi:hypothetical protein
MGAAFAQDLHGRFIPSGFAWAPRSLRICMGAPWLVAVGFSFPRMSLGCRYTEE